MSNTLCKSGIKSDFGRVPATAGYPSGNTRPLTIGGGLLGREGPLLAENPEETRSENLKFAALLMLLRKGVLL